MERVVPNALLNKCACGAYINIVLGTSRSTPFSRHISPSIHLTSGSCAIAFDRLDVKCLERREPDLKLSAVEEAEVPLEGLQEHVHHTAEHSSEGWISGVALSTAILAVLAAIAGLLSGKHANEAMMTQIEAADQWAYYQAKGIKASVLEAKITLSGVPNEQDREKAERYQEEQKEIQNEAKNKEKEAKSHFHQHEILARGVTMFQIAIAVAAISALTKKRRYWIVSLLFGSVGCVFLVLGIITH